MNYTKPKTFVIHKNDSGTDAYRDQYVHALEAEIERLQAIVDKLPKCWRLNEQGELVQDEPMCPGMEVWWIFPSRRVIFRRIILAVDNDRAVLQRWRFAPNEGNFVRSSKCYLTREAAEAARKK